MSESKFRKLIVALTVGAVLLFVILLSVMVYQLVSISNEKKKETELINAITEYEKLIEEGCDTLEARSSRWWIERRARELGLNYKDDVSLSQGE